MTGSSSSAVGVGPTGWWMASRYVFMTAFLRVAGVLPTLWTNGRQPDRPPDGVVYRRLYAGLHIERS
jgi:hypothetical protein